MAVSCDGTPIIDPQTGAEVEIPCWFLRIPKSVGRKRVFFGNTKRYLGARNRDGAGTEVIPSPNYTSAVPLFGNLDPDTWVRMGEHFQGVTRFGTYLVLSGGLKDKVAELILVRMGSRKPGPWNIPEYDYDDKGYSHKNPAREDRVWHVEKVHDTKWHAGGIQAANEIVGVPVYGDGEGSQILFLKFDEPTKPERIFTMKLPKQNIEDGGEFKAKAVGMTRVNDGGNERLLLAVWDDQFLDFHVFPEGEPKGEQNEDTPKKIARFAQDELREIGVGFTEERDLLAGTYQNVSLVTSDERYFIVATKNESKATPTATGKDLMDLYEVSFPDGVEQKPRIVFLKRRQMFCHNKQCNFGAAAGAYRLDDDHVFLYGAYHFLLDGNKRVAFNEFSFK